ncbi:MAG: serine hydroxymethyltransferase [Desulfobacteraceae bacterium]|nr:serine hydroxymethyltransferase [Desulfobacteraceae bacterium]MBU4001216.1 serine hydroxymethyltransferase [Pseudomonadota bacterium]MBU4055099.1 serine hydroxymethyltransferase [Pseudomonadota bacterium]
MPVDISDILTIVEQQNQWRGKETLNMIASENTQSPAVRQIECNDFMGRYAEGHPNTAEERNRYYEGTAYIDLLESMAEKEIIELTGCKQADVRPISGNQANTAIAISMLRGGDTVIANSIDTGGHISHNPIGIFGRRIQVRGQVLETGKPNSISFFPWPTTPDGYHLDTQKCMDLVEEKNPRMVILGKSLFLFPEPVKEISEVCRQKNIAVLYDAAHVLGLIAGKQFQDPIAEGAHFVAASTHKTFPGPQRGVILGNLSTDEEMKWWGNVDRGVMPGSSSNHHLHTIPGLVVAIREMKAHGMAYATQIVKNAKALGQGLDDEGVLVDAKAFGFTKSHQIAVNVSSYGPAIKIARDLAESNIIVNYNMLPGDRDAKNPSGLRIGVQELTRFGMKEAEMGEVAGLIKDVLKGKMVKDQVTALRSRFTEVQFA